MNSAVDTESCSELPLLITKLLKDLGVSYQIQRDRPNIPAAQRVQAVLLDDSIGAMLVLFPQDHLLDLARLAELTGRELAAVKPERLARMLAKHELSRLPGLPPLTSSPCLYEECLMQQPRLLVESGQPGLLAEVS
ncbi:YbaK/EbsC family protein, partial [Arthrobacter sp. GMC3]|uniref:YbaK/EbsC family protein n=1 Tax=Arthrobacter sp. GMC3 TaxID=2058894 RepID=UPI0011B03BE7